MADLKATDIKGAEYNPRTITDGEKEGLKNSMDMFQNISTITFNTLGNCLVAGHRRWEQLNAGKGEITLKKVKKEDPNSEAWYMIMADGVYTTYDLRVVKWEHSKEMAANVAANSHTIAGKFDQEMLSTILQDLDQTVKLDLRLDILEFDLGLKDVFQPEETQSSSSKEVDVDSLTGGLNKECPKCGFEFE